MFSQASVILSTIGLMNTRSLLILVGYSVTYGAVDTHPTGMLSCSILLSRQTPKNLRAIQNILVKDADSPD